LQIEEKKARYFLSQGWNSFRKRRYV